MDTPLISVIVPVYNVKKYLHRCVYSIINQTYKKIEIILVDDGSTDGSSEQCDLLCSCDSRIKVIHKENGGLSSARNAGIDKSSGVFLSFVDSDDWINESMIADMLTCINAPDMIACTMVEMVDDKGSRGKIYDHEDVQQSAAKFYETLLMNTGDCSVWSKLFPREIIGDIRFDESKLNEDILFLFSLLGRFDRIVYTGKVGYYYYQRADSISRGFGKAVHDIVINAKSIRGTVSKKIPELNKIAEQFEIHQNISLVCRCPVHYQRATDKIYQQATRFLRKNFFKGLTNTYLKIKDKLKLSIIVVCPIMVSLITETKMKKT